MDPQLRPASLQPASLQSHQSEVRACTSAILPLPADVVVQIKSSVTITTLASAVLGLVQNSLDAEASKITIDVDFRRGCCVVEDDGLGILPAEFDERGGLGKLHHTSKYKLSTAKYGSGGVFVSSLASLCLLNITSHHHQHRSTNSITFHNVKPISRLIPAPSSHGLDSPHHGTKVTVRDLFGSMPVRVKQRYLAGEDRSEQDRLWESVKHSVVALLIASGRVIALKIRDLGSSRSLTLSAPGDNGTPRFGPGTPEKLRLSLATLQQAGLLSPVHLKSWVPASASSRSIVIKGGICTEPVPSKATQFLSLDICPLLRSEHNELYDRINKLFSRSRFGMIEEEPLSVQETARRQRDRRFKQDGLTNKQLLTEKGVDRWPMFVLSITFKGAKSRHGSHTLDEEVKLASVISVLDALVNGWLASNHFRPQKRKVKELDSSPELESSSTVRQKRSYDRENRLDAEPQPPVHREERPSSKRRSTSPVRPYTGVSSMNELSRIKSGDRRWLDKVRPYTPGSMRPQTAPGFVSSNATLTSPRKPGQARNVGDKLKYSLDLRQADRQANATIDAIAAIQQREIVIQKQNELPQDAIMIWTDPITKHTHRVNSRTGAIVAPDARQRMAKIDGPRSPVRESRNVFTDSLRLPSRTKLTTQSEEQSGGWLENVLKDWQNPVFRCAEKNIQQASLHVPAEETGAIITGNFNFTSTETINQAFREVSHLNASRITKQALNSAQVISQVDQKFILVALQASNNETVSLNAQRSMLVVIDQHAADERVKVEQLLRELSEPFLATENACSSSHSHKPRIRTSFLTKPLTYRISAQEIELFQTYAQRFADWGILYDIPQLPKSVKECGKSDIAVRHLPSVIAERCKLDPKLLINLLRTELWKLADSSSLSHTRTHNSNGTSAETKGEEYDWLRAIGSFPQGILDMVNSRACRSAIMFNDALSRQDCEKLVEELAKCKFPFTCAHGRPSMVPLLDIGGEGIGEEGFGSGERKNDFVGAFEKWQKSMEKATDHE